jgi:hypothetical protein
VIEGNLCLCFRELFLDVGLRYNEKANVFGAQTKRRGEATRLVRDLLPGETSPALLLVTLVFSMSSCRPRSNFRLATQDYDFHQNAP